MNPMDPTYSRRAFLTCVGASVAVAIFPTACGGAPAATTARKRIAFGFPFRVVDVYKALLAGARQEAAKRNYQVIESSAGISAADQLAEVNAWIAEGVEGIVHFSLDPQSFGPVVDRAHAAGIKVIGYAVPLPGEDGSIIFNNAQGGKLIGTATGNWINTHLGGHATVGVLANVGVTGAEDRKRVQGAIDAMQSAAPGATVVASAQANDAASALTAARPMLSAHPDINVFIAITDDDIIGLESALKQAGKQPSSVWWASYDSSSPVLKKMLTGELQGVDAGLPLISIGQSVVWTAANAIEKNGPTSYAPDYILIAGDDKSLIQKTLAERGAA